MRQLLLFFGICALPLCALALATAAPAQQPAPPRVEVYAPPRPAPLQAVSAADDLAAQPRELRKNYRYLDAGNLISVGARKEMFQAHCGLWNGVSRVGLITAPYVVPGTDGSLWRINLEDYGIDPDIYDKLAGRDIVYHEIAVEVIAGRQQGGQGEVFWRERKGGEVEYWTGKEWLDAKETRPGFVRTQAGEWQELRPTRWVPTDRKALAELVGAAEKVTVLRRSRMALATGGSQRAIDFLDKEVGAGAILRADVVFDDIAAAGSGRVVGYYEILGLKKLDDFFKLVGFDKGNEAGTFRYATAFSQVAQEPRALARKRASFGPMWITFDFKQGAVNRDNDPLRVFGKDVEGLSAASRAIGFLPNELIAFVLVDNQGNLQNNAPDDVASCGVCPSNDKRVLINEGCIRCHTDGYRDWDDHVQKLLSPPFNIRARLEARGRALAEEYLHPPGPVLAQDRAYYGAAIKRATGLSAAEYSKAFARRLDDYRWGERTLAWAAADLGVSEERVKKAIEGSIAAGAGDVALAVLTLERGALPRSSYEAAFQDLVRLVYPEAK